MREDKPELRLAFPRMSEVKRAGETPALRKAKSRSHGQDAGLKPGATKTEGSATRNRRVGHDGENGAMV